MPKKVPAYLLDTNIVLDLIGKREPFVNNAVRIFALAEKEQVTLWVSPHSLATIYYFLSKSKGRKSASMLLEKLLNLLHVAPIDETVVRRAFTYGFRDWEDALVASAAQSARLDGVITRNVKDFKPSPLPVLLPEEVLAR
ncbi:MAG: PIN domain-containing protein [Actinomycetaceae bacterium]|nr:PIN domain-containing protein [Actinomycetaceae bacterium]